MAGICAPKVFVLIRKTEKLHFIIHLSKSDFSHFCSYVLSSKQDVVLIYMRAYKYSSSSIKCHCVKKCTNYCVFGTSRQCVALVCLLNTDACCSLVLVSSTSLEGQEVLLLA